MLCFNSIAAAYSLWLLGKDGSSIFMERGVSEWLDTHTYTHTHTHTHSHLLCSGFFVVFLLVSIYCSFLDGVLQVCKQLVIIVCVYFSHVHSAMCVHVPTLRGGRCVPIREVSSFQRVVCRDFNGVGT